MISRSTVGSPLGSITSGVAAGVVVVAPVELVEESAGIAVGSALMLPEVATVGTAAGSVVVEVVVVVALLADESSSSSPPQAANTISMLSNNRSAANPP